MVATLPFFTVLVASVIFSVIVGRLHIPWVIALIGGGMLIGPHALGLIQPDETLNFLAEIGLVFLMFMAGLETRLSALNQLKKKIFTVTLATTILPFIAGISVGLFLDYDLTSSLLIGIIFIASSIAVVIPALEKNGLLHSSLGRLIVGSAVLNDIISLVALSVLLQTVQPATPIPLPLFYVLLAVALVVLRWLIPKLQFVASLYRNWKQDLFQQDVRIIFALLIGIVVLFQVMGLHPIIAGFFAGVVLSESIRSPDLKSKIHAISYGVFIPIFFILIGARTDISILKTATSSTIFIITTIIAASLISKIGSGYLAGRFIGLDRKRSLLLGSANAPHLSTSLAVALTSFQLGIADQQLLNSIIILALITTVVSTFMVRVISTRLHLPDAV